MRTKGCFRCRVSIDRSTHPLSFIRQAGWPTSFGFSGRCKFLFHTIGCAPYGVSNIPPFIFHAVINAHYPISVLLCVAPCSPHKKGHVWICLWISCIQRNLWYTSDLKPLVLLSLHSFFLFCEHYVLHHLTAFCFVVTRGIVSSDPQFSLFHCVQMAAPACHCHLVCLFVFRRQHHSAVPFHEPLGFLHCCSGWSCADLWIKVVHRA